MIRFDPYAQQKLEQREEAIKKFYKEEGEGEEEEESLPESKETKVEVEPVPAATAAWVTPGSGADLLREIREGAAAAWSELFLTTSFGVDFTA